MKEIQNVINLENVTVDYGNGKGIYDVNLKIKQGKVQGLVGPSGSGKTTLLRVLLGFIKANSGIAEINNLSVWKNSQITNNKVGYISGEPIIPNEGTGKQYLKYYAKLRGIKNLEIMNKLVAYFELDIKTPIKEMSKGMKQRLAIIAALMGDFDIYVFDEPTSGLDPIMCERFIKLVLDLKQRNKTILFSSHIMDEIQKTCDDLTIIKNGKQEFNGSLQELKNKHETVNELFWKIYEKSDPFKGKGKDIYD